MTSSNQATQKQQAETVRDKTSASRQDSQQLLQRFLDTRSVSRLGLWVLLSALGGFVIWASLAPLDEGVPTSGLVTIDTKSKTVQHLSGGIVKELLVKEGQVVKEGELMIRLDEAVARSNYESVRQRYLSFSATHSRLQAEQAGLGKITFRPEVIQAAQEDQYVAQQVSNQRQLMQARQQGFAAELQALQEAMASQMAQRDSSSLMSKQRELQLILLNEELGHLRELVREGYAPRNRQLELERQVAEIQSTLAELRGSVYKSERSILEIGQRLLVRKAEYRKEVDTQMADTSRDLQAEAEKYVAVRNDLRRIDIAAPASGQVIGLAVHTAGAVIQPGQKLMDVVPRNRTLLLEAKIPPHLIDKVAPGLDADVRFSAFAHSPQLVVTGRVLSVSGDLLADPSNPQNSYFLARVEVTPEGVRSLGQRLMQPGMPAEIIIRTGSRSMLTYLLGPLTRRLAFSMKEE